MILCLKEFYRVVCFFCLFVSILTRPDNSGTLSNKLDKIKLDGKWFVDSKNRKILFHGINAVKKEFPWIPNNANTDMTNMTQILNLKKWGFNVVRLGVMWSGVMPLKNYVNQTYLDEIVKIVDDLASHGIYTLIDLHQDMLSSKFESYDGAPSWILDELPVSKFQFPWPLKNKTIDLSLFAAYLTEPCGFAFQCLYKDTTNFGFYFNQYWATIAKTFTNNSAILGYELINEPWAGDIYADPLLLLPSVAGGMNLLPFYDKAYSTIRQYDSETLVFYEPVTWGVLFNKKYFGTGFNRPPGNDVGKTVFSWHYYCWLLALDQNPIKNESYPEFDRVLCDHVQLYDSFAAVDKDMKQIGNGASFLTEFGVCAFDDPTHENPNYLNTFECESILNMNDKYFTSWTYWDSNFYDDNLSKINEKLLNVFSRVYPIATNGIPESLFFNSTTKIFSYTFLTDAKDLKKSSIPTEIFIPANVYPTGFRVILSDHLKSFFKDGVLVIELADSIKYNIQYNKQVFFAHSTVKLYPVN